MGKGAILLVNSSGASCYHCSMPINRRQNQFKNQWLALVCVVLLVGLAVGYVLYGEHGRVEQLEQDRLLAAARVMQINIAHDLVAINDVLPVSYTHLDVYKRQL